MFVDRRLSHITQTSRALRGCRVGMSLYMPAGDPSAGVDAEVAGVSAARAESRGATRRG
jgi:hypothetical protein